MSEASSPSSTVVIDAAERRRRERAQREALGADLFAGSSSFTSRPSIAYLVLSNFCNMSCTMCYNGVNPPTRKMAQAVVERFERQVAPDVSTLLPFGASEPLIVTWDTARDLSRRYSIKMELVTNVQFLDEAKFEEMKDIVRSVCFSIDSHLPEVYERIRLRARTDKVFRNLPIAARLCKEHGLKASANVVFMTDNGETIPETIAWLADQGVENVHILQFHDNNGSTEAAHDPLRHLAPEQVDALRQRSIDLARERKLRLCWYPKDYYEGDHREKAPALDEYESERNRLLYRLRRFLPGFCEQVATSVKVDTDGEVYPCCMGGEGHLRLGNLEKQDFEEIWNGPEARDLRRAMYSQDLPSKCVGCSVLNDRPAVEEEFAITPSMEPLYDHAMFHAPRSLTLTGPRHLERGEEPPLLSLAPHTETFDAWRLLLAIGGEEVVFFEDLAGGEDERRLPEEAWESMRPNFAHLLVLWGMRDGQAIARVREAPLIIRHHPLPRVPGSTLVYPDMEV